MIFGPLPLPSDLSVDDATAFLQKAGIDTNAFAQKLAQASESLRVTTAAPAPLALTPAAIAAATRGYYLPSDLADPSGLMDPQIETLLSRSNVTTAGGQRAWRLRADTRRDILVEASNAGLLAPEIANRDTSQNERDAEGSLLRQVLAGRMPSLDTMSVQDLEQLVTVSEWLSGTQLASVPQPDELRRVIGRREILDPFRALVGRTVEAGSDGSHDRVVGRDDEMEALRAYVGVLGPEELKHLAARTAKRLWSIVTFRNDASEPLLVKGIGGMGKSTLIAKFVLDHALFPGVDLPFVYLDFDRAALAPHQPLQLMIEICIQLGVRHAAMESELAAMRDRLRQAIDSQSANLNRQARESVTSSELRAFCTNLRSIVENVTHKDAPVLMLFDTFEVVQYDEQAVNGVKVLIAALREAGSGWNELRLVVAGRGDLADIETTHDPVELRQLSVDATGELLRRRSESEYLGLTSEQIGALARPLSNSPLDVIVVTNWLKNRNADERSQDVADLVEDIDAERDEGEAAHAPEIVTLRITGILTKRMIEHINDRDVRALAFPGLVVRAVTPAIIRRVMAPASERFDMTQWPDGAEDELFRRLEREGWLVRREGNVLRHRPEVRRAMLALMQKQNRTTFERTNELALTTFTEIAQKDTDNDARAEAIYHRLLGGKPLEEADALWTPSVGTPLASAVDDLDPRGQAYLTAKLGRSVPVDTLLSFPPLVLRSLLASYGASYLRQLGPATFLRLLQSSTSGADHPALVGLRYEALYRDGRWDALRDAAGAGPSGGPVQDAVDTLWQGDFGALGRFDDAALTALRFLLRWATRDPLADRIWGQKIEHFARTTSDPAMTLNIPELWWDFATLTVCGSSSGLRFTSYQRDAVMARAGEFCREQTRLPDATAGSDALRVLAFFETGRDRPILRRVDFANHFATVSGREIDALRDLVELRWDGERENPPEQYSDSVKRGSNLLGRLKRFADDAVIADPKITSEFADVVHAFSEWGGERISGGVLRTLAQKHPDWLQPLGGALTYAYKGNVPRKIGWWSSIDKYFGSGGQPRKGSDNATGQEILSLADEASSLAEAITAYKGLLISGNANPNAANFLALAQAFSIWVEMIDGALDEQDGGEPDKPDKPRSKPRTV